MAESNEQWLTDGNCGVCRRQSYCSKPCKKTNDRMFAIMRSTFMSMTGLDRIEDAYRMDDQVRRSPIIKQDYWR